MSTERWNDDHLDRLAEMVLEINRAVLTTNQNVNQLVTAMQEQQEANTIVFQAIVQEIRGLRAENRRILTHLFGEQSSE